MPRIEMLQAGLIWAEKELNGWAGEIEGEGEIVGSSLPVGSGTLRSRSGRLLISPTRWPRRKRGGPKRPERTVFVSPFGHDRFLPTGRKEARTRAVSGPKSKEETPKEGCSIGYSTRRCAAQ